MVCEAERNAPKANGPQMLEIDETAEAAPPRAPAMLGSGNRRKPMTLNALSAGLLVAVTSAGMAQEPPRSPELPRPPELLRTRFCSC